MPTSPNQADHVPERSAHQRSDALSLANSVRTQRAALRAQIQRGEVSIASVLDGPAPYLAKAKIAELLLALPRYGPVKVGQLLERCGASPQKTVAGLSERQRRDLIRALKE